mmetsp:Transcript_258/g.530  ORF Transcript_258/g.530 Transcript_258/m.530 type:complete len:92 (+) Transcript_258:226-501(+)
MDPPSFVRDLIGLPAPLLCFSPSFPPPGPATTSSLSCTLLCAGSPERTTSLASGNVCPKGNLSDDTSSLLGVPVGVAILGMGWLIEGRRCV